MRLFAVAAAVALVAVPSAGAMPPQPSGKVLLGVATPDPAAFDRLTGKHHSLRVMFGNWTGPVRDIVAAEDAAGRLPVLTLPPALAPADVAAGGEDARWLALSRALNGSRLDVWVRVFPEMTGGWNAWCAFDESGRSRGARYSTHAFVGAFRRVAVILRGGLLAQMNARLHAAGLTQLRGGSDIAGSGRVAIVWNPQGHGVPFIPANGPRAYWPGPGYVDIVADDMYSDSAEPSWHGMDALYAYGKPFFVGEWSLENEDDVAFTTRMFAWVTTHPRTIGLAYFDKGWSGGSGIYELRSKAKSLALYRRAIKNARFLAALP